MSDDLVKRLADADAYNAKHYVRDPLHKEAKDRIEELTGERDEALNQLDSARHSVAVLEKRVKTFSEGWGIADKGRIEAEAKLAKAVEAAIDTGASLAAAISLLERGGKKAAPSNKMFDQMMVDYRASLERTRTTLAELKGDT